MTCKNKFIGAMLAFALVSVAFVSRTSAQDKMVGQATCAGCHAEVSENFAKTFHGRKSLSAAKLANSCEACHGAGGAHADGGGDTSKITNPKKLAAGAASDLCMSCHKDKALMMWKTSSHANNGVSCLSCHSVHEGEGRKSLVKGGTDTCLTCHKKQQADMRLASHHPVAEGKMTCVSCHNPHGGIEGNLKADSEEELCAKCHSEKVGPFAFEHAPVSDGCNNCHAPHGSANDKLLTKAQPYLCLSCHKWPHTSTRSVATAGVSIDYFKYRGSCIGCHREIHGSNRKAAFKD